MITINRTFEEIYSFYTKVYYPMEQILAEMIENYFVRHLDGTNEDEPQEVHIPVLSDNTSEPDSEFTPIITKMWIDKDGIVNFSYEDCDTMFYDFTDCTPYQMMSILEAYSKNYEHLCDTNNA